MPKRWLKPAFIGLVCIGAGVGFREACGESSGGGSAAVRVWRQAWIVGEILDWLHRLRSPVRVAYEAESTGFGLTRALADAEIDCVVAVPSKLIRPARDRVKTDARDAAHLTRLLRLSEVTAVTVPEADVEAVRDIARAGEDARADLRRVRHRLSKLLRARAGRFRVGKHGTGARNLAVQRTQ
jgi:transposase